MAAYKSIFEFEDLFGISSTFGNWIPKKEKGIIKDFPIDFKKLCDYIKDAKCKERKIFDYKLFEGDGGTVTAYAENGMSYTKNVSAKIPLNYNGREGISSREIILSVDVNKKKEYIDFKEMPVFKLLLDTQDKIEFSLIFRYNKWDERSSDDIIALKLYTSDFNDFIDAINYCGYTFNDRGFRDIKNQFLVAFKNSKKNVDRLIWLYQYVPNYVLADINDSDLYEHLESLSQKRINTIGTNENIAALNILAGIKDKKWLYNKINVHPAVIRILFQEFDKENIIKLIMLLSKVGVKNWNKDQLQNLYVYQSDPIRISSGIDENIYESQRLGSYIQINSYCVYKKEINKFQVGYIVNNYGKGDIVSKETTERVSDLLIPFAPIKLLGKENEEIVVPAFVGEYFTNISIDEERLAMLNLSISVLMPEISLNAIRRLVNTVAIVANKSIKTIEELVEFLSKIDDGFRAVDLEKVGISVLFRGTTKSAMGEVFQGSKNAIANGLSTSTDPIRATIFAIESANDYRQKGIVQVLLPKKMEGIYLNAGNYRFDLELEVVVNASAENLSNFVVKELTIEEAIKIIKEIYHIDLPKSVSSSGLLTGTELLMNTERLSLDQALQFYKKIK